MFGKFLEAVRRRAPRIHSITNHVTINQCANMLLASGSSPIMAEDSLEAAEITGICDGLNLNMGTLSQRVIPSMLESGKRANQLGLPVVLDPVGVSASGFRMKTVEQLLGEIHFSVIRGNLSEIKALAKISQTPAGVDADRADWITEENLEEITDFVKAFSLEQRTVTAVTGAIDIVTDGHRTFWLRNGHPMMSRVTGTGCQLSALAAAFAAASPGQILASAASAVAAMGLCGQIAHRNLSPSEGNASYGTRIIDAMYHLTPEILEKGANYEIR